MRPDFLPSSTLPPGKGRARVTYEQAADGTKRNRTAQLAKERAFGELVDASAKRALSDGHADFGWLVKKLKKAQNDGG